MIKISFRSVFMIILYDYGKALQEVSRNDLGTLLKIDFNKVGLAWGQRFCFSNKLTGNAAIADLKTTLGVARI